MRTTCLLVVLAFVAALVAVEASGQALPFRTHGDFYIADHGTSSEAIFRYQDLNQDGDVQDPGEQIVFYDLTGPGPNLTNMQALTISPIDGSVWVSGTSLDIILRLEDKNGDGDANDAGEFKVFYDNTGAQAISSVVALAFDKNGVLYLLNSGSADKVVRLQDKNNDGDALDSGEATIYLDNTALSGAWLVSPSDMILHKGDLYVVDNLKNVIVRLRDLNLDGDAQDLNEGVQWAVAKPSGVGTGSTWNIIFHLNVLYGVELGGSYFVRRWEDKNSNNNAMDPGEATMFFDSGNNASKVTLKTSFSLTADPTGSLYVCNHTADTVYKLTDVNQDLDTNDLGEVTVYVANSGSPPPPKLLDRARDCVIGPAGVIKVGVMQPRLGQTADWLLDDLLGGGLAYVTAVSFGNAGIPLPGPDIRSIPLTYDALVFLSLASLLPNQQNFQGTFHATGQAVAKLGIPNVPGLVNLKLHMAFVTLKPSSPSGVLMVSKPFEFTILP